jgi:hypothetical protein
VGLALETFPEAPVWAMSPSWPDGLDAVTLLALVPDHFDSLAL